MMPTEEDIYFNNRTNRTMPNLSKNRNRTAPTKEKLRLPNLFPMFMPVLELIGPESKFYKAE